MKLHEYTTLILGNHNDENGENCSPKNTASGIRQGWAAPEVLQAADGDAETEYVKWPAVCNEPMTNVRTGAGVQNSIMTAWPLLGIGNQVDVIGQGMAPNGVLWYKILIANQYEGWVCGAFLDPA